MNNTHGLPTEATLRHLAESGDAEQLRQTLGWLRKAGGVEDLVEKAKAAGMRLELHDIFEAARKGLGDLEAARPNVTKPLAEQVDSDAFAEGKQFEDTIDEYLGRLSGSVDRATANSDEDDEEPVDHLGMLENALGSDDQRQAALGQLRHLGAVDEEWLATRAYGTVEGVKESLWGVVHAGREFAADVRGEHAGPDKMHELGAAWGEEIDAGIRGAAFELDQAIHGLDA